MIFSFTSLSLSLTLSRLFIDLFFLTFRFISMAWQKYFILFKLSPASWLCYAQTIDMDIKTYLLGARSLDWVSYANFLIFVYGNESLCFNFV